MECPPRPPGTLESIQDTQAGLSLSFPTLYNKKAGQMISVGFQPSSSNFPFQDTLANLLPPILSPLFLLPTPSLRSGMNVTLLSRDIKIHKN